jgi:hypothetical protein
MGVSTALSSGLIREEVPRICAIRLDKEPQTWHSMRIETIDELATAEWSIWVVWLFHPLDL